MHTTLGSVAAVALLTTTLAACAGQLSSTVEGLQQFRGHLSAGPAGSHFRPCDAAAGDTLWWASFQGYAIEQRRRLDTSGVLQGPQPVYVRVYGRLTSQHPQDSRARGTSRQIDVHEVVETRLSGRC